MRYFVPKSKMSEWKEICRVFAKSLGAKLVFVNDTSCGVEFADGTFKHILVDEMQDYLKNLEET